MIWLLRLAFSGVLISMLCVTSWAQTRGSLWDMPRSLVLHPWFIATLFDTYFAFLTFYVWLAYRETSLLARALWLIAILALGNIAMSAYMLLLLWRLPVDASMAQVLLRPGARATRA
jgi:predicted permease